MIKRCRGSSRISPKNDDLLLKVPFPSLPHGRQWHVGHTPMMFQEFGVPTESDWWFRWPFCNGRDAQNLGKIDGPVEMPGSCSRDFQRLRSFSGGSSSEKRSDFG